MAKRANRREPVADRVSRRWKFWEAITTERDAVVRRLVRFGYSIEWTNGPCPPCHCPNQPSAAQHGDFLDAYVADFISSGDIAAVPYRPHCVHPLGVIPKPRSTKLRPIPNMRSANAYMVAFRFDSLIDFASIADREDVLIALDMIQGYYHVALRPDSRTFAGFQWRNTYYVYNVLAPFGMSTAPRCFAKVMGVLVRHWRAAGIRMLAYLDDWLFILRPPDVARVSARILADCLAARVAINREKSQLTPVRELIHLGFEIDMPRNRFCVPEARWSTLQECITELLRKRWASAREIYAIAGRVISMALALGPAATLFTRCMYSRGTSAVSWDTPRPIPETVIDELHFWRSNPRLRYTSTIWHAEEQAVPVYISDKGWGATILVPRSGPPAHGFSY